MVLLLTKHIPAVLYLLYGPMAFPQDFLQVRNTTAGL